MLIGQPAYFEDITGDPHRKLARWPATGPARPPKGDGQATHVGPPAAFLSGFRVTTTGGHREAFAVLRAGRVI